MHAKQNNNNTRAEAPKAKREEVEQIMMNGQDKYNPRSPIPTPLIGLNHRRIGIKELYKNIHRIKKGGFSPLFSVYMVPSMNA
jgi:hypothetical protein